MAQAFRGNACFTWTDVDDRTSERVLRLREPVREPRLAHAQSAYRAESLDKRTVTTFTVGEGVDEFVCRVRYGDDPQGLLDLIKAGTKGRTISYFPDLGNPGQSFDLTLIAPISPLTLGLDPDTGTIAGEQDIELRFRRTDFGAFTVDDYGLNATVLFRLRGGGRVEEGTFTRADATTCATYVTKTGTIATAAANVLRTEWVDLDGDNVRETPAFLLEGSRTNVCLRSQDFANWSVSGTPTIGAAITAGDLSLDLLGDDDGAALEFFYRTVTFTGNAVKAVSLFAKSGTTSSDAFSVRIYDNTAPAYRLIMVVNWDVSGVPTVEVQVGSNLGFQALGNGIYRFNFQTTAITAANSHDIHITPSDPDIGADTGNVYVGGVQVEDAPFPSSYIKTTTATVTRAADSLTFPIGFGPQDDLTVLARLARPVWADASGSLGLDPGVYSIGTAVPQLLLFGQQAARNVESAIDTTTDSRPTAAIPAGTISLITQYKNLTTGGQAAIDVGSGLGAFASAATAFSSFGTQTIRVGAWTGGQELYGDLIDLVVARGLVSLRGMQGKA